MSASSKGASLPTLLRGRVSQKAHLSWGQMTLMCVLVPHMITASSRKAQLLSLNLTFLTCKIGTLVIVIWQEWLLGQNRVTHIKHLTQLTQLILVTIV